ncbi:MAG: hypothetical protein PVH89_13360 [Gammaproteobacteria bacterium]
MTQLTQRTLGLLQAALCAAIAATSSVALGQQLVGPQPISQEQPPQPVNADGVAVEGWAVVRYSILEDGSTSNVRIVDIAPAWAGPDDPNPFSAVADSLRSSWQEAEILRVYGRIDESPWQIDAGRRIFTIDNVDGQVTSIEAECDSRHLTLDFQPEVDWQIPESLGRCSLLVNGESGTSFSFSAMLPAG